MARHVPDEWRPGAVILDLYEVRDVIRSGGMGLVYRIPHRDWNVELAVKVPRPALAATEKGLRDFEAEAATWVGLGEHPHTVNCVYVRTLGGVPTVFAEWLDGGSLAEAVHDEHLYAGGHREALRRILDIAVHSPEQAEAAVWTEDSGRPRTQLTRATDTWSWALTVLGMFVGHPPCRYGQTGAEALGAFVAEEVRDERIPPSRSGTAARRCPAASPG
ncbi:protein kinase [Streptomyces sp. L-9-10]|uniref:hypothetical protein n=1 Tax=Streptomyces sp. L-9-10 TaxID=1478131 RepID=UPI00101C76C9|nr:hypothetical protein [Streptomyces sp. L-9-10]RYJ21244.1 protein kinase [Streptomyces sp. L-9-10]